MLATKASQIADGPEMWRRPSADRAGCLGLHPTRVLGGVGRGVLHQDGVRHEVGRGVRGEVARRRPRGSGPGTAGAGSRCWRRGRRWVPRRCRSPNRSRWSGWCRGRPSPRDGRSACRATPGARRPGRPCRSSRASCPVPRRAGRRRRRSGARRRPGPAGSSGVAAAAARPGPRRTSDGGGLGGGLGSVVVPVTTARRADGAPASATGAPTSRSARSQRRRRRTRLTA